jgi:hypothetical protein
MATTPSPREYSLSLTVTQNEPLVDPRGEPAVLCFGYRLGTGVPPWGPPPHSGPAVHRYSSTALHWAAAKGDRRIVRLLVDANADVNAKDCDGCAVCARGVSAECAGRVPAAVGRAGRRRCTLPRPLAIPTTSRSCCCAAPTGPSRKATGGNAALRRTAETETRSSRARAGRRRSNGRKSLGSSRPTRRERGRCTPPAASRPPLTPPASRPIPPRAACAVGACRRRSPIQRGGRQQPTQHTHCNERPRLAPRRALLHRRVEV